MERNSMAWDTISSYWIAGRISSADSRRPEGEIDRGGDLSGRADFYFFFFFYRISRNLVVSSYTNNAALAGGENWIPMCRCAPRDSSRVDLRDSHVYTKRTYSWTLLTISRRNRDRSCRDNFLEATRVYLLCVCVIGKDKLESHLDSSDFDERRKLDQDPHAGDKMYQILELARSR